MSLTFCQSKNSIKNFELNLKAACTWSKQGICSNLEKNDNERNFGANRRGMLYIKSDY